MILVTEGSVSMYAFGEDRKVPIDSAIVAIIDTIEQSWWWKPKEVYTNLMKVYTKGRCWRNWTFW